ncbi:PHD finger protein 14 [Mortierella claussenii]|nr:PHD finger protein 14 [Mortierella claussenii]
MPLSNLLNAIEPVNSGETAKSDAVEEEGALDAHAVKEKTAEAYRLQEQTLGLGSDVSDQSKGARAVEGSSDLEPDNTTAAAFCTGDAREQSGPQMEAVPLSAGLKRGSRQMSFSSTSLISTSKTKETATSPVKKKAKTEAIKKSENDTASLFQKIFADRDPGKRKIKTKSVHEIPMDLAADEDDSDFEDTKVDSNDEDEDMVILENAATEDEFGPDQQEALNDEQDLLTALWQWASRSTEADNVFVYCDTLDCALCVHQACYGVKTLPSESEPWLCDRCKAPPEEVVSCVCCPSKDGAFRRLIADDPSGGWVHVVCALWLPETTLGDPDNVDKISVRDIPEKNWNLTCYMCSDPQDAAMGACVQCDAGQCRKSFHITCAQGYSLLETIEETDMADPYFMYCKQHGATDGHPKLNGWAKWIKQRDAFLKKWQDEQGRKRTLKLINMEQSGYGDEDGGNGLVELFEHSYSRFKQAREKRIARERSELSRQYSIGYYLGNKIEKSRSRLEVISSKAQQALLERRRIEMHTRNLLSSLLECANYLENVSEEHLEAPLSIDTTLAWYNELPDTSRWKSNIQDIIETIDTGSLACDNPYTQLAAQGHLDSGLDDSEGGQHHGRSSKGIYSKVSKKGSKALHSAGKNVKSKKVHPKPTQVNKSQIPTVFTSSRGRLIRRDILDPDEWHSAAKSSNSMDDPSSHSLGMHGVKISRPIVPCTVCHQLTLPEEKLELERDVNGVLSPMTIKVLNRLVSCDTCQRQFHPKCLDPPMARVPPRGYSWNCEDCDSSDDSQESSGEASSAPLDLQYHQGQQHHHTHSSDLDEALMVLADTAMTMSANSASYQSGRATKRPHDYHGQGTGGAMPHTNEMSRELSLKGKIGKAKKIKTEGTEKLKASKYKPKATTVDMDAKPKPRKALKAKEASSAAFLSNGAAVSQQEPSLRHALSSKSAVAPIIRGNLRIYPSGPHIAPMINTLGMKQVVVDEEDAVESAKPKVKAVVKKVKVAKSEIFTKQDDSEMTAAKKTKKVKTESTIKTTITKTKKVIDPASVPVKSKVTASTLKKKAVSKDTAASSPAASTVSSSTKAVKATKNVKSPVAEVEHKTEKAMVRRGSLSAVPVSPPKPKEVIRYTVGEKTVEELTAREDVEIERRENVKFRKLRGRTLTMPAPPQEVLANAAVLAAEAAAAAAAAAGACGSSNSSTVAA